MRLQKFEGKSSVSTKVTQMTDTDCNLLLVDSWTTVYKAKGPHGHYSLTVAFFVMTAQVFVSLILSDQEL